MTPPNLAEIQKDIDNLNDTVFGTGLNEGLRMIVKEHDLLLRQVIETRHANSRLLYGVIGTVVSTAIIAVCSAWWNSHKTEKVIDDFKSVMVQTVKAIKEGETR